MYSYYCLLALLRLILLFAKTHLNVIERTLELCKTLDTVGYWNNSMLKSDVVKKLGLDFFHRIVNTKQRIVNYIQLLHSNTQFINEQVPFI